MTYFIMEIHLNINPVNGNIPSLNSFNSILFNLIKNKFFKFHHNRKIYTHNNINYFRNIRDYI